MFAGIMSTLKRGKKKSQLKSQVKITKFSDIIPKTAKEAGEIYGVSPASVNKAKSER